MSRIVVLGGGLCGLAAALLLSRDGHDVTVLERDAAPVPTSPEDAWEQWARAGVTQFRQTHYLTPRGRVRQAGIHGDLECEDSVLERGDASSSCPVPGSTP
jgi:2-polyprenyl-6-methoxyphenol hydroxylase-like FAD-dependent oxidoreductase